LRVKWAKRASMRSRSNQASNEVARGHLFHLIGFESHYKFWRETMIDMWSNCCIRLPFEVKLKEPYTLLPFCNTVAFVNNNSIDFIFRSVSEKQSVLCEFSSASRLPNTKLIHLSWMSFISAALLSGPIIAAAIPCFLNDETWSFIRDTKGDTTRQKDAVDCVSAKSPPTQMASNKNRAISEHSDFPEPAGEQKHVFFIEISLNNFFLAFS